MMKNDLFESKGKEKPFVSLQERLKQRQFVCVCVWVHFGQTVITFFLLKQSKGKERKKSFA